MTRISDNYMIGMLQFGLSQNRSKLAKHTEEISSGFKVQTPVDTSQPGLINKFRDTVGRMESHLDRIQTVIGGLEFQEGVIAESGNIVQRALELATQSANETYSVAGRAGIAEEIFGLRDQLVALANSNYQGSYVFGGAVDNTPPYTQQATTPPSYTVPATGPASIRYAYTSANGAQNTRTVELSDTVSVRVNGVGSSIFTDSIDALERLGRALSGYQTGPAVSSPPSPTPPDGSGSQYNFPADYQLQTQHIRETIDLLKRASTEQISTERASLGARMNQLQSARSVVDSARLNARESLSVLQDADIAESATNLTQARSALEATMTVSGQVLRLSILDYL